MISQFVGFLDAALVADWYVTVTANRKDGINAHMNSKKIHMYFILRSFITYAFRDAGQPDVLVE